MTHAPSLPMPTTLAAAGRGIDRASAPRVAAVGRVLVLATLLTGAVGAASAEDVVMATEASFPPFSQTEPDGSYTGFEIDLGDAVCERAGWSCTWVKQDFDGAIAALLAGKFDVIFSSMSIKPERAKVADFSIPYYSVSSAVFAETGSVEDVPGDLDGRNVGVYGGSTQDQYARDAFEGASIRPYENIDQMSSDLVAGRIDAMFVERTAGEEFLAGETGQGYALVGEPIRNEELDAGAGAMTREDDPRMTAIDEALRALYADGTFDEIQARWLPEGSDISADHLWE